MIGKWHLGLGIATLDGESASPKGNLREKLGKGAFAPSEISNIDWKETIQGGPVDLGFDSWYGIPASLDFPPYVWIRDRNWVAPGTHAKAFRRPGPASEDFEAIDVLGKIGAESVKFIAEHKGDEPFFVYIPLTSPHTPIVPTKEWQGKSVTRSLRRLCHANRSCDRPDHECRGRLWICREHTHNRHCGQRLFKGGQNWTSWRLRDTTPARSSAAPKRIFGMAGIVCRLSYAGPAE